VTDYGPHSDQGDTLLDGLGRLLADAGLSVEGTDPFQHSSVGQPVIRRLGGGANNAVFRVDLRNHTFVLKQYFSDSLDHRDRFAAEVAFLEFAWDQGICVVPQLLATYRNLGLALLEFIEGDAVSPSAVTEPFVEEAIAFCLHLLSAQANPAAQSLPVAAEACFSIDDHLACVDGRIRRLKSIRNDSEIHGEALQFVQGELSPTWNTIRERVRSLCQSAGMETDRQLAPMDRCLSPSDFGFHNCVLDSQGNLRFFDFEYAGWDDPAKLVGDFFCQVEVPVPRRFFTKFAESIASAYPDPDAVLERIRLLFPVYQLKWCCIVLNEFLPAGEARREFSEAHRREDRHPKVQLEKARGLLNEVESGW